MTEQPGEDAAVLDRTIEACAWLLSVAEAGGGDDVVEWLNSVGQSCHELLTKGDGAAIH